MISLRRVDSSRGPLCKRKILRGDHSKKLYGFQKRFRGMATLPPLIDLFTMKNENLKKIKRNNKNHSFFLKNHSHFSHKHIILEHERFYGPQNPLFTLILMCRRHKRGIQGKRSPTSQDENLNPHTQREKILFQFLAMKWFAPNALTIRHEIDTFFIYSLQQLSCTNVCQTSQGMDRNPMQSFFSYTFS